MSVFDKIGPTLEFANEEEWRRGRSTFLGGSDAAVLYGKGYAGQELVKLFAEKFAGAEPSFEPAQLRRFALGKAAEPVIRSWLQEETNWEVVAPPTDRLLAHIHPDYRHIGATLDAVVVHPHYGLIPGELKRVGFSQRREWEGNEYPAKFFLQCQHQMLVTGSKAAVLAGMIDEDELAVRVILRDDKHIAHHIEACRVFWDMVEAGVYTGPIGGEVGVREAIAAIFGRPDPAVVVSLGDACDDLCRRYKELGELEKSTKKERDAVNNQLRFALGSAIEGITSRGTRVSLTEVAGCTFTTTRKPYFRLNIEEPKR